MPTEIEMMSLVEQFMKKFLHGHKINWGRQFLKTDAPDVDFYIQKETLRLSDLLHHFHKQRGHPTRGGIYGSLSIGGNFSDRRRKWFCIDGDNSIAVDALVFKLVPVLDELGIEYLYEHSGANDDRCHLWVMCDCDADLLAEFVKFLFEKAKLNIRDKDCKFEIYPLWQKEHLTIRVPGGYHARWGKVFPIVFRGEVCDTSESIIKAFLEAKQITDAFIRKYIAIKTKEEKKTRKVSRRGPFRYFSQGLKMPDGFFPELVQTLGSNCQAINKTLWWSIQNRLIQDRGPLHHLSMRYLSVLGLVHDSRRSRRLGREVSEGRKWAEKFLSENRDRTTETHHPFEVGDYTNVESLIPKCKTWERDLDACAGCKFKDRPGFSTPRQIFDGKPIGRRNLGEILNLVSHDEIRRTTFPAVRSRIISLIKHNCTKDLLIASPQGSGKSVLLDEIVIELARMGKRIIIAVPTGDLAMEHFNRIKALGGNPFVLMSHRNIFAKFKPGFECPFSMEIQHLSELGVSSRAYKKSYCEKCPEEFRCPFPHQFADMILDKYPIIIVQHAHFTSEESRIAFKRKGFDCLFVDEAFIDNILVEVKATPLEIAIVRSLEDSFAWAGALADWMEKGGYPQCSAFTTPDDLELIKGRFDDKEAPWRFPEFQRYFNNDHFMDANIGLYVFYPLPDIPVRVLTDATPPLEMLEIVLDNKEIEVYGDKDIFDYRKLNSDNKLFQVLDTTASKTSLQAPFEEGEYQFYRFIEILEFIADKAHGEYKDKKILITTYKAYRSLAESWLKVNFPDIMDRILIGHMAIGTNAFAEYEVQFLVCGVYFNARDYHKSVFKLRTIANWWNRNKGRPEIPNFYHFGIGDDASIEKVDVPVRRIECFGPTGGIYVYDDFVYRQPESTHYNLVEKFAIAKTQQAIRLRFNDNKLKHVYVFGNFPLPNFLVTNSVVEDDLLGYLRRD